MFEIERYTLAKKDVWDQFVRQSKNGTFLFLRDYMDYHSDRFADHSIMAWHKGRPYAVLPANIDGDTLHSHQGLTYGGWLMGRQATVEGMCSIFKQMGDIARQSGIRQMTYKAIPWIYHSCPAEEDLYALHHVCSARITSRHVSSTIDLRSRTPFTESRKSGLRKAMARNLAIEDGGQERLEDFWKILENNLSIRHHVSPVHTLDEMRLLTSRFPDNIRLFVVTENGNALGGTLLYLTDRVVHTQYISATEEGKACGALDFLFNELISRDWGSATYFDFGRSTIGDGSELNNSLLFQKEGFGARAICSDVYSCVF